MCVILLDRVEKRGNEAGTSTQNRRKLGVEPKANSGSRAERPRGADYEDFEEAVDDIGDGGFKDETIGHPEGFWQPRNQRDFMYFDEVLWQKKRRGGIKWREIKRLVF